MLRLLPICIAALISIFPFECSLGPEKANVQISLLAHEDPVVRSKATFDWAYASENHRNLRMLLKALDDENPDIRKGVCCSLFVGLEVVVPELVPDPDGPPGSLIVQLRGKDDGGRIVDPIHERPYGNPA